MRLFNKFGEYTSLGQTIQEDSSPEVNKFIRKIRKKISNSRFFRFGKIIERSNIIHNVISRSTNS